MPSLNKVILIGHLGRDAELQYLASGKPTMKFSVACSERFIKNGEWQDKTEWFNVVCFGDWAERKAETLSKGDTVYIEGKLQTRTWEKDDGSKAYFTEVVVNNGYGVLLLKNKQGDTNPATRWVENEDPQDDDDLPFE